MAISRIEGFMAADMIDTITMAKDQPLATAARLNDIAAELTWRTPAVRARDSREILA